MRQIVMDTETTGFYADRGDRLVEIGCVELLNYLPTGRTFHVYINPERDVPEEAARVHGLTAERLKDEPKFADVADEFLEFIGNSPLIMHNAPFDVSFLKAELGTLGKAGSLTNEIIDTLTLARKKFPTHRHNTLDDLCKRFDIDKSERDKNGHGALLDSKLLARVYFELIGGAEPTFLSAEQEVRTEAKTETVSVRDKQTRNVRSFKIPEEELSNHQEFMKKIKSPLWEQYSRPAEQKETDGSL